MFRLEGPYPLLKTTVLLPSPQIGNNRALQSTVQTMRSVDGTLRTYIKPKRGRRAFTWDFLVAKDKALEVKEFIRLYAGSMLKATDHNSDVYVGWMVLNPIELAGEGRAASWPGGEAYKLSIRFEEKV